MNFEETLEYLYTLLPMYQRVGPVAFKKDLGNIIELTNHLGKPQQNFKSIHVAGTNGKGSVSHILAAILIHQGYKVGYYTSPHLVDFRERIRVNGEMIPKEEVVQFVQNHKDFIERIQPSFFEITVAMAFDHFSKREVDLAIIEVGLGGRLDSTNIINPLVSVITNIGHDHMDMLGDTLEKIAFEKAGIIKPDTPVIIGEMQEEIVHVFEDKAKELNAPLSFARTISDEWKETDLKGHYQQKNIQTSLKTLETLGKMHGIQSDSWREALKDVAGISGLRGRWQRIRENPTVIADTGHNEEGIAEVIRNLQSEAYKQLHMVFGMVTGKNFKEVLAMFPSEARYYLVKPEVPRGLPVGDLLSACDELGYQARAFDHISQAYSEALRNASEDDLVFVGGSTFTVADFLKSCS